MRKLRKRAIEARKVPTYVVKFPGFILYCEIRPESWKPDGGSND